MIRSVGAALLEATEALRTAGLPTPRLDAEVLIAHVTGHDRAWVLAHPEAQLDEPSFGQVVERRAAGEPVAYIRGFKEWHSLRILTDARALIPRPETELLADAAIAEIEARLLGAGSVVAWEVATGSGAIAVGLAIHFRRAIADDRLTLIASDLSAEALDLAAENLAAHHVDRLVRVLRADLLGPAGGTQPRPEVVIANLPYVASAEVDERKGSLGFEPRIALDGGPDGLVVLRRLFQQLSQRAAPGSTALLEIGVGQAEEIGKLVPRGASVSVVPDLAGLDRVLRVQLP